MSTTDAQLLDLANYVTKHNALDAVKERVDKRLIAKFRAAKPAEREELNHMMDADSLFLAELSKIIAENEIVNDEEE